MAIPPPLSRWPDEAEIASRFFRSLGHPIRLQVLGLLEQGELAVGEIQERLGLGQSHLSNHLACLRNCGLVTTRAEGRRIFYRWADPGVGDILRLARPLWEAKAGGIAGCRHLD